ncbi:MAG: hypothetical protein IT562_15440 [Alphaproteobacteria bacterium]|nr:hypothetical protein [Alphaproteobacteria bacterium]
MIVFTGARVFFPAGKPCTKLVMEEMMAFPEGRHDDVVACVTQFPRDPEGWIKRAKRFGREERVHLQESTPSDLPVITVMKYRSNYWDRNGGSPPF